MYNIVKLQLYICRYKYGFILIKNSRIFLDSKEVLKNNLKNCVEQNVANVMNDL